MPFDPSKPFEIEGEGGGGFDPSRPFAIERTQASVPQAGYWQGFKTEIGERAGEAAKGISRIVPATMRAVSILGQQPAGLDMDFDTSPEARLRAEEAVARSRQPPEAQPIYRAADRLESAIERKLPSPEIPDVWHGVAQGAGQALPMVAGGAIVRGAGASVGAATALATTMGGVQEFDDAFIRSRERGDDADTAFAKALGYASVAALLENKLGAGRILRQYFPDAGSSLAKFSAQGVSKNLLGNFVAGGVEEGAQRLAQNWIVEGKPSMEGVAEEAVPGAIVQSAFGLPAAGVGATNRRRRLIDLQEERQNPRRRLAIMQRGELLREQDAFDEARAAQEDVAAPTVPAQTLEQAPPIEVGERPAAPRVSDEELQVAVQAPMQMGDRRMPGYVQIDSIVGGQNQWSSNPEKLKEQGYDVPTRDELLRLPQGKYSLTEAKRKLAELDAPPAQDLTAPPAPPEPPKTTTVLDESEAPVVNTPLSEISLSKDVPNFKAGADPETGVVPGNRLEGKYIRIPANPVTLWRRLNGKLELITGRHRFDLASRSGEKTIPSQIVDEAKGFTRQDAMAFDAATNIRDGQGSTEDYADFFRNSKITEEGARSQGLLDRAKGRNGFDIGALTSEDVFAAYKAGKINESQAAAIARSAPRDANAQAIGTKYALQGKGADFIFNVVKAAQNESATRGQELDLFGNDDSAMREMEQRAEQAVRIQKTISEQIQSVQGAAKRPELAGRLGVDVRDPAGITRRVEELRALQERWRNWPMHPDLVGQLKTGEIAMPQAPPAQPAARPASPAPAIPMASELEKLMKLRQTIGKGATELRREGLKFIDWANKRGINRWDDITDADLIDYATEGVYEGREVSAESRNKYLRFIPQIFKWLSPSHPNLGPLSNSVAFESAKPPPRVEGSQGKYFAPEATAKLVAPETSDNPYLMRDKAFFALMRYTGFRVEDVLRLRLDQIDLDRGLINNALISKRNVILPMRAIPELAVFNLRRYIESGARGMLDNAGSEYLFPGTGKKGFMTVSNALGRIKKLAEESGVKLANDADAQTTAFRNTFAQDLTVNLRLDKMVVNELSGRVGQDVTETNYLARHNDPAWVEGVNRPNVSKLPENAAFVNSPLGRGEVRLPQASREHLQWRQRLDKNRNLAKPGRVEAEQAPLFDENFEATAIIRAGELRAQADENDRLAGLRAEAHARGSVRAAEEYVAYRKEAERLRKEALRFDRIAKPTPAQKAPTQEQTDMFSNMTLPDGTNPSTARRERIGYNPNTQGFTVTYGKTPMGQDFREISVDTPEELMFLVSHPSLNISDEVRNTVKGIVASGILQNFPSLRWAVSDYITGTIPGVVTYRAEHIPAERLIRLHNFAAAEDPAHELLHHLQYYLRPEDRDWIRAERQRLISEELQRTRPYKEIGELESLRKQQVTSDQFVEQGISRDLYHLANEYEFFAWMMTDKAAKYFNGATNQGFIHRIREAIRKLMYSLRKFAGLTSKQEEIFNDIINGTYQYDQDVRRRWLEMNQRNLTLPVDEPGFTMGDRLDPETAWAQIESASTLAIPRIVDDTLQEYQAAGRELEAREYDTERFRAAKAKVDELVTAGRRAAQLNPNAYWQSEEGIEQIYPASEELPAALTSLGVEFDPNALRALQQEIRFENRARTLAGMRRRLADTGNTVRLFQSFGWQPEDYAEFTRTEERLRKAITRMESDGSTENAGEMTVRQRADQIQAARSTEPVLRAKSDALDLPFVRETFVAPAENGVVPEDRLSRTLMGFTAAMSTGSLSSHYKDAIAKLTWDAINRFVVARQQFQTFADARRKEVAQSIRSMRERLADTKIEYGLSTVLSDEISRTGRGERGLTGTLSGRDAVSFMNDSYGTVLAFANNLRAAYPNGGAEAVLMRVLSGLSSPDPGRFTPDNSYFGTVDKLMVELRNESNEDLQAIKRSAGVADFALARILYVLARSDRLEDAFGALTRYARRQLATEPANQLDEIGRLMDSGDVINTAEATDRLIAMAQRAQQRQTAAGNQMAGIERELADAAVVMESLDYGQALFDKVTGTATEPNAEFVAIRRKALEWLNVRERMILSTAGTATDFGGTTTSFRSFKIHNDALKIDQPDLNVDSANEFYYKEENFNRIKAWFKNAEQYVLAFRSLDAANHADPANNPAPEMSGFDRAVYNGLEDALREQGRYLDPTILWLETKSDNNFVEQFAQGWSFFRQFLQGSKQAQGQAGRDLVSATVQYGNALNKSKAVYQRHRLAIQEARKKALDAHKDYCQNDLEIYRTRIFNEMASEGRQFGVNVRAGMTLPVSGQTVTPADIDLLKRLQAYYTDLRRNVSEVSGRGVIEARGNQRVGDFRVFTRGAASVGEEGLPMTVSEEGDKKIKDLLTAYTAEGQQNWPTATSDITPTSPNQVVQFWNRNANSLVRHILDAGRQFRVMEQEPMMVEAERRAAAELRRRNDPLAVKSLQDAVNLIARYLPSNMGSDPVEYATQSLLSELQQYYKSSASVSREMSLLPRNEGIGGMSIDSEFTTPAAQFRFPSNWYDFGTVTNRGLMMLTSRVMHEPIVELSKSLQRTSAALKTEIEATATKGFESVNYRDTAEAIRVRRIIDSLLGDLKKAWDINNPDVMRRGMELPPDFIKASLLASPTVNIRNIITGAALIFLNMQSINRYSRLLGMVGALRNVAGTIARFPIDLISSEGNPIGKRMMPLIRGPLRKSLGPLTEWMADRIVQAHVDSVAGVQELGFSLRDPFVQSLKAVWRDTAVAQTTLGGELGKGRMATAGRFLGNVGKSISLAYRTVGTEYFDKLINAQSIGFAGAIERMLMEVAPVYGTARENLGEFDPSDPRWSLDPSEFSKRLTSAGKSQNLAQLRAFMAGADLSLEHLLWNYHKASKEFQAGQRSEPSMFTDEQYAALRAASLRAFNAGDALNRPTAMSTSKLFRLLATFQGYSSNFLLNLFSAFNVAKNQSTWTAMGMAIPTLLTIAFANAVFGLWSDWWTDWYRRTFQGAAQRQITIGTREFWTDWGKARTATAAASLSVTPYIGDMALFARSMVVNNRGYEPTGRILSLNLLNGGFAAIRGMFNLYQAGDVENIFNPVRDFGLQITGGAREAAYALSPHYGGVKDFRGGQGVLSYAFEQAGFKEPRPTGTTSTAPTYGPTTGIKEDIASAMMRREVTDFSKAYQKLVGYYQRKGLEKPEAAAERDFESMHPIVRAMAGKKPTQEQYDRVYSGLSDTQRQSVNASVAGWDWGASNLGISYNPISGGARAGLGFGGGSSSPSRSSMGLSRGVRPISLSRGRTRKIRIASARRIASRFRPRKIGLASTSSRRRRTTLRPRARRMRLV